MRISLNILCNTKHTYLKYSIVVCGPMQACIDYLIVTVLHVGDAIPPCILSGRLYDKRTTIKIESKFQFISTSMSLVSSRTYLEKIKKKRCDAFHRYGSMCALLNWAVDRSHRIKQSFNIFKALSNPWFYGKFPRRS